MSRIDNKTLDELIAREGYNFDLLTPHPPGAMLRVALDLRESRERVQRALVALHKIETPWPEHVDAVASILRGEE